MGEDEEQLSDQEYGYVIVFLTLSSCSCLIQLHITIRTRLIEMVAFPLSLCLFLGVHSNLTNERFWKRPPADVMSHSINLSLSSARFPILCNAANTRLPICTINT